MKVKPVFAQPRGGFLVLDVNARYPYGAARNSEVRAPRPPHQKYGMI